MWNNFTICLLLLLSSQIAFAQEDSKVIESERKIVWEQIKGAFNYHIQIRDKKDSLLIDERIEKNYYDIKLPEGKYQYRVGVYNKFVKISAYSDWVNLNIRRASTPNPNLTKLDIDANELPQFVEVYGNDFSEEMKIELKQGPENIPISFEIVNPEKAIVTFLKPLELGQYDLYLYNPKNRAMLIPAFLIINDKNAKPITLYEEKK
jgi:hypothetical protein